MHSDESISQKIFWKRHYRIVKNVTTIVILILYLTLGAVVFHFLEAEAETEREQTAALRLQQLLENLTCISHGELQQLLALANDLSGAEVSRDANTSLTVQFPAGYWSVDGALFFSMAVLTTIGYGKRVPKTPEGQVFCLFYALFGIPLLLLVVGNIGFRIAQHNFWLTERLFGSRLTKGSHKFCTAQFVILVVVGMTFLMILPSVGFMYLEGWTYPESFYHTFITLSTIGFGDYVIGLDSHLSVKLIFILWLPSGLAWFSAILSTIEMLEDKIVPHYPDLKKQQKNNGEIIEHSSINTGSDTKNNMVKGSYQHLQGLLQ